MRNQYTKRLSVFFTASVLAAILSGIPSAAMARPIPSYILLPLTIQALGYALPRIEKRLTPQQRQKVQALREETFQQVEAVLTQVQRSKIVQGLRSRQNVNTVISSLKLTPKQKARIQSIIQTSRQKINTILSEDASPANHNQKS
jgi:YesN/AraC family two-component response regulator